MDSRRCGCFHTFSLFEQKQPTTQSTASHTQATSAPCREESLGRDGVQKEESPRDLQGEIVELHEKHSQELITKVRSS